MAAKLDPKWKKFERIAAAINAAEAQGAKVVWNEKIGGRQFDVTLRFKNGFYEFLVVIECKDYGDPVPVEKVDALVTKSRDVHADKAVMISANGFQSGAKNVAGKHNITLMSLGSINKSPDELARSFSPVLHLSGFRFHVPSDPPGMVVIPDEIGVMRSLMRDCRVQIASESFSLEEVVALHRLEAQKTATATPSTFAIELPPDTFLIDPNIGGATPVSSFEYEQQLMTESEIKDLEYYTNEPSLSPDIVEVKDAVSGESRFVDTSRIHHGFDTVIQVGKFYTNPNLGFFYYVDSVDGDLVTYYLVESYQLGNLIQCCYTQDIKYSIQFVEVTDADEIRRLNEMLGKLTGSEERGAPA